jgi:hypothetical protein
MLRGNSKFKYQSVPYLESFKYLRKKIHTSSIYYDKNFFFRNRWCFSKADNLINNYIFSYKLSKMSYHLIKAKLINVWAYLTAKNLLYFRTYQRHLWNRNFKRWRFQYANYYDIISGFFLIGLFKNS